MAMKVRIILIGIGALVAISLIGRILATSGGGGAHSVAVDTTGASASSPVAGKTQAARKNATTPGPKTASQAKKASTFSAGTSTAPADQSSPTASASATPSPAASPTRATPTPTPVIVQVQGQTVNVEHKPVLLLNPSTVGPGSTIGVGGSGFDPAAAVDLFLKQKQTDQVEPATFVQADKSGGFGGVSLSVPSTFPMGSFVVEARQRNSDKTAVSNGVVGGGVPQVKLGTQVGKPGDTIELSASGFSPDEDVNVCWNTLTTAPLAVLHADGNGNVRQGSVRVPFGAVGNNTFIFVGSKSQSPANLPFLLLNLYPTVQLSNYAIKADNVLNFSGKDFGPKEKVSVHLNSPDGPTLVMIQSDDSGGFANGGGILVPFGLKGPQTLIFIGEQSKAPATATFDIQPYTPTAQPSTYGGRPGTTVTFYGAGFARNEVVKVFLGRTRDDPGKLVSCFKTDDHGNVAAGGNYVIPGDVQAGQLQFALIGDKSQAPAASTVEATPSDVPVQVPSQGEFKCQLEDENGQSGQQGQTGSQTPQATVTATPASGARSQ